MVQAKMNSFFKWKIKKKYSHNLPLSPHSTPPYSHSQIEPSTTQKTDWYIFVIETIWKGSNSVLIV